MSLRNLSSTRQKKAPATSKNVRKKKPAWSKRGTSSEKRTAQDGGDDGVFFPDAGSDSIIDGDSFSLPSIEAPKIEGSSGSIECPHFKTCSGCQYDSNLHAVPIALDAKGFCDMYKTPDAEPFKVHVGAATGWRTQAKLAAGAVGRWGGCSLGLYEARSHNVVPIPDCAVHHPAINAAAAQAAGLQQLDGRGSSSLRTAGRGARHRQGAADAGVEHGGLQGLRAVPATAGEGPEEAGAGAVALHLGQLPHGPGKYHIQQRSTEMAPLPWTSALGETVGPQNIRFFLSPQSFRQGNLDAFSKLVERIDPWVPEGARICELYSGVGIIGLNMAHKAEWVRCSDISPSIPRSFEKTVAALGDPALARRVSYLDLSAEDALAFGEAEDATVLVVDPPRKGLGEGVLRRLADPEDPDTGDLERLIYVSCGFDAFKGDALALVDGGGWELVHAEGHILFPGSDHIETLAIFDRQKKKGQKNGRGGGDRRKSSGRGGRNGSSNNKQQYRLEDEENDFYY
eukprot:CAMPEP_0206392796 /NCGR_PEP_ID=MMETSP0294-20121207/20222_1 /ASSEMBLY_ACC=CAM_ASM_000327 /TAXON_ID=39354 /ORGANISM="Heterosigma akashiwo, Strain CCMP2393" /LENGTH=511 /DNA_ID=CAMNT_0053846043 /DNA_START=208 /DNA_END=1744 /DNA_ORIENTATION=-